MKSSYISDNISYYHCTSMIDS